MEKFITGKNKYITLVVVFLIVAVISFFAMAKKSDDDGAVTVSQSKIPVVNMVTEAGTAYNMIYGYSSDIDVNSEDIPVSPLTSERNLLVQIETESDNIKGISYKIRDLADLSLIEKTQVSEYSIDNGKLNISLNIKNLIDDNKEYLCELELETATSGTVRYYTKVIHQSIDYIQQQIDFVLEFNGWCFSGDTENLAKQLESKYNSDTTDYGNTNIYSSKSMILWGAILPSVTTQLVPEIVSVNGSNAVMKLEYQTTAESDISGYDTFNIAEEYDVTRNSKGIMYLMAFNRKTNQVFDGVNDLSSVTSINLGINSTAEVDAKDSNNNNYIYYVINGNLWGFSCENATFAKAFSMENSHEDKYAASSKYHDINILSVDESGNCVFMVYGYFNRGIHEGKMGISLMKYDNNSNTTEEMAFIPQNKTYEQLKSMVGEIEYVDDNNVFYFKLGSNFYALDPASGEVMNEASGLTDGNYSVSDDKTMIAFATDGNDNEISQIKIINVAERNDYTVKAPEDCYLKIIGFVENDFVYGVINKTDLQDYPQYTLMSRLEILNPDFSMARVYDEARIYITEASAENMRVSMKRVEKNEDGTLANADDDQLINKNADESRTVKTEKISAPNRLKELHIALNGKAATTESSVKTVKAIRFFDREIELKP